MFVVFDVALIAFQYEPISLATTIFLSRQPLSLKLFSEHPMHHINSLFPYRSSGRREDVQMQNMLQSMEVGPQSAAIAYIRKFDFTTIGLIQILRNL